MNRLPDFLFPYVQITSLDKLPQPEEGTDLIGRYAFLYLDFTQVPEYALGHTFVDCCFFGCKLLEEQFNRAQDCLTFPKMNMVFKVYREDLYTPETLYEGYAPGKKGTYQECYDYKVYHDYLEKGTHCLNLKVMLARSLHDHGVYDAMVSFLIRETLGDLSRCIGIMGGHGLKRKDKGFWNIVRISKELTEKGYLMISGGGPGAMEATHLGAWMAGRSWDETVDAAVRLAKAGEDDPEKWLESAFDIRERYPQQEYKSLSIPTWLYGHEPSTPLATHIAKYFTNSVREDMILSVALGGIIFTPGSAGTMQEVFQNAAKVHYDVMGKSGPMVFLGVDFFTKDIPVYPFLKDLIERKRYSNMKIRITDDAQEAIEMVTAKKK